MSPIDSLNENDKKALEEVLVKVFNKHKNAKSFLGMTFTLEELVKYGGVVILIISFLFAMKADISNMDTKIKYIDIKVNDMKYDLGSHIKNYSAHHYGGLDGR